MTGWRGWRLPGVDINEICERAGDEGTEDALDVAVAMAEMNTPEVDELIRRALDSRVPVGVLFAALDRYTTLAWLGGGEALAAGEDPYLTPPRPGTP